MNNNFESLQQQAEMSKRAVEEMKRQIRLYEQTMETMVKTAPDDQKTELESVRLMSIRALNLAKQGKSDEAQQLIKDFKNGGKNK